jgi:hypothetical protein
MIENWLLGEQVMRDIQHEICFKQDVAWHITQHQSGNYLMKLYQDGLEEVHKLLSGLQEVLI